jgi:hypothetical protein
MVRVNAQQLARAEMTHIRQSIRRNVPPCPESPHLLLRYGPSTWLPRTEPLTLPADRLRLEIGSRPHWKTKNTPPTGNAERTVPPPPNGRTQSPSREPSSPPRAIPPRLITTTAPLPPTVPFEQRRPAMSEHPGRPLEPSQLEDLGVGRPVCPMHDREFPPHVAPVIPERPAPAPARPRFSQMKPK